MKSQPDGGQTDDASRVDRVSGRAVPVVFGVGRATSPFSDIIPAHYGVSDEGTLVYVPATSALGDISYCGWTRLASPSP